MTHVKEAHSRVSVTTTERAELKWSLQYFEELYASAKKKTLPEGEVRVTADEIAAEMTRSGLTVKLGTGKRASEKKKLHEIGDVLGALHIITPGARGVDKKGYEDVLATSKKLKAFALRDDMIRQPPATQPPVLHHPEFPDPIDRPLKIPRYDLGVTFDDVGDMKGLVFNALFRSPFRGRAVGHSRHPVMEGNSKGGLNVALGPDVTHVSIARPKSIRDLVAEKVDEGTFGSKYKTDRGREKHVEDRLKYMAKIGYMIDDVRPVLIAHTKDGGELMFGFRAEGEVNSQPMTEKEKDAARAMGFDPDAEPGAWNAPPRNFGIFCIDECLEAGDLFGQKPVLARRPVINIYHPVAGTAVQVEVSLTSSASFSHVYPKPAEEDGPTNVTWQVKSGGPSGELFDPKNERRYAYLYWEALQTVPFQIDRSQAYCVKGEDTIEFLEKACAAFAFNAKEKTDFISYWITMMERNEYNIVQFVDPAVYGQFAHMEISPTPDQVTRVFMIFERSNVPVDTGSPDLPQIARHAGFVVTEWGGSSLDDAKGLVK